MINVFSITIIILLFGILFFGKQHIMSTFVTNHNTHHIKFKLQSSYGFKHIDGIPTHYAHLIKDLICPLLKYRNIHNVDKLYLYTPSTYNKRFKSIVETILPFVKMIHGNKDMFKTVNIKKNDVQDLKVLHEYSKNIFMDRILSNSKYILLINRGTDNTLNNDISKDNGVSRRSIKNKENLKKALDKFCSNNNIQLKTVVLEDINIVEQIKLFKYATIIIAQHGASLANTVWCTQCKLVIEYITMNNMWYKRFHQFSDTWITDYYESNHILVNIPKTISILDDFFTIEKETITMCLWINPNHQLKILKSIIEEWVRYYKYLGTNTFICCNNGMDKFEKVKKDCLFLKKNGQMQFYNDCLMHCKTKWMICFDLDEFFVYDTKIHSKNSLKHFLIEHKNFDILYIKWRIIGHNNLTDFDSKMDIVKQYKHMTCENFKRIKLPIKNKLDQNIVWGGNNITKWIGKTNALKQIEPLSNMHLLNINPGLNINIKMIDWNVARLNHYYILSKNALSLPSTQCKHFIGEKLINNKCVLGDTNMSFREYIQNEISKNEDCVDDTLCKIDF